MSCHDQPIVMLVDLALNGHDVQVENIEYNFFACDSLGFKSNGYLHEKAHASCC
jgi:hypothetical protein